ncbi:MAG: hypothetical protein JKY01_00915 [Pseudomonadales bacterium]|nr:hypothetical protein [Pseudomonadales bacterium]
MKKGLVGMVLAGAVVGGVLYIAAGDNSENDNVAVQSLADVDMTDLRTKSQMLNIDYSALEQKDISVPITTLSSFSVLSGVTADRISFDGNIIIGNEIVYDSEVSAKELIIKADQVYIPGSKNGFLDDCTVYAKASISGTRLEIDANKMTCFNSRRELIDHSLQLSVIGNDGKVGLIPDECEKIYSDPELKENYYCANATLNPNKKVNLFLNNLYSSEYSFGHYSNDVEKNIVKQKPIHEGPLGNNEYKIDVALTRFGSLTFNDTVRTIDDIPISLSSWKTNGYRKEVRNIETESSDDGWRSIYNQTSTLSNGSMFRTGWIMSIVPKKSDDLYVYIDVAIEYKYIDEVKRKGTSLGVFIEDPVVATKYINEELKLPWNASRGISVEGIGKFFLTVKKSEIDNRMGVKRNDRKK